ncbi:MAG TPA: hypothetical protein VFM05_12795 [Candidatus Saccharimonadales bacterium]|nr:hypothetical protein [Candidatus Saccharimonadales bacterium]
MPDFTMKVLGVRLFVNNGAGPMQRKKYVGESGFTLLELCVVTLVILIGSLFSLLFLLTPKNYDAQKADGERRAEIAYIAAGLKRYLADQGTLPPDLPTSATAIGSYEDHYDLCKYLVPSYMKDIPDDPGGGIRLSEGGCDSQGARYATGYAILLGKDGRVTVSAPFSELDGYTVPKITIQP